jgi:hypothetical protein
VVRAVWVVRVVRAVRGVWVVWVVRAVWVVWVVRADDNPPLRGEAGLDEGGFFALNRYLSGVCTLGFSNKLFRSI